MVAGNVMIESLGVALPSGFRSAAELVRGCRVPLHFNMEAITGISEAPTAASEDEYASGMAEGAIADCLSRSRCSPEDVELVIGCTLVDSDRPGVIQLEPTQSQRIQQRFGFNQALCLDVSAACAGLFVGLRVAQAFLEAGAVRRALIFAGEYVTHVADTAQREIESANDPRMPCLTVGDSGAALMLELGDDPARGLLDFQLYTLGRYSNHCVAKPSERAPGGLVMKTNTVRLALITSREGMSHFERLRQKLGPLVTETDFFVPHQASAATLGGAMRDANKRLGQEVLGEHNVINNLAHRGNTVTTTHFMAVHDAIRQGRIQSGQRLLLSTVASGATIGSAVYQLDDLPARIRKASSTQGVPAMASAKPAPASPADTSDIFCWRRALTSSVVIESIAVAEPEDLRALDAISLGKAAARRCLARSQVAREDIEVLIFAGVYKSEFIVEPAIAAFLAGELRINDSAREGGVRTLAFDLNDSANGFLSACQVAARLIETGVARSVMVVVAEADVPLAAGSVKVSAGASAAVLTAGSAPSGFTSFGAYAFPGDQAALRSEVLMREQGGAELSRALRPDLQATYTRVVQRALGLFLAEHGGAFDFVLLPAIEPALENAIKDVARLAPGGQVHVMNRESDFFTCAPGYELARLTQSGVELADKRALIVSAGAGLKVSCAAYTFAGLS